MLLFFSRQRVRATTEVNSRVCAADDRLANMESGVQLYAATLTHSHVHQILKNVLGSAQSSVKEYCDGEGRLSIEMVRAVESPLAGKCDTGLRWHLLKAAIETEEPNAIMEIQAAANILNAKPMLQHEMQGILRLAKFCDQSSDFFSESQRSEGEGKVEGILQGVG